MRPIPNRNLFVAGLSLIALALVGGVVSSVGATLTASAQPRPQAQSPYGHHGHGPGFRHPGGGFERRPGGFPGFVPPASPRPAPTPSVSPTASA